jgi:hypothetical protein
LAYARNNSRPNRHPARPRLRYNLQSRVGLVMGRDMDYAGLGDAEAILMEEGVSLAPMECQGARRGADVVVLPTAGLQDLEDHKVKGIVVPGGHAGDDPRAATELEKLVNTATAERLPVMAFGDAVPRALESLGFDAPRDLPPAVLLHDGVRILETEADVRDAATVFRRAA